MDIKENISLKAYNSFGIDVCASKYVEVNSEEDLQDLLSSNILNNCPFVILGGGSNIVFVDDFDGIVVRPTNKGIRVVSETATEAVVEACAGEIWSNLAWSMTRQGYYGLENLVEIPGCVGAAPIQNVGAYGVEAKDTIKYVVAYEIATGNRRVFYNNECHFGYRNSIFKNELKNQYIVMAVGFSLSKTMTITTNYSALSSKLSERNITTPTPLQIAECIAAIRSSKLPDPKEIGSAGSFFKNPIVTYSHLEMLKESYPAIVFYPAGEHYKLAAGWLIEQCGWKGRSLGRVGVYDKQALVLFNKGGCNGHEVINIANAIEADVESKFGVKLEREAIII